MLCGCDSYYVKESSYRGHLSSAIIYDNKWSIEWEEVVLWQVKHVKIKYHYTQNHIISRKIYLK